MTWHKLDECLPSATESGEWDGLKSEPLLVCDSERKFHVAVAYIGILDGNQFIDFYSEPSDFEIKHVVYWQYIEPVR